MDKIRLNALSHIARSNLFSFKRRCAVRRPWVKFSGMQFNEQLQSDNSSMPLGSAGGRPDSIQVQLKDTNLTFTGRGLRYNLMICSIKDYLDCMVFFLS